MSFRREMSSLVNPNKVNPSDMRHTRIYLYHRCCGSHSFRSLLAVSPIILNVAGGPQTMVTAFTEFHIS
jgi:hypothetical protein